MTVPHTAIERAISDRIGNPFRVTAAAAECLSTLANELPLPSWELRLLVSAVFGLNDLLYLLFRTLYAGGCISDTGIALLILSGKRQSQLHLGKVNRWFLDEFEGFKFDTGDPPAQSKAAE